MLKIEKGRKLLLGLLMLLVIAAISIALTTQKSYAAIDEMEPNNSVRQAQLIKVGTYVYGTQDDEADYFKFVAPISGTMKLTGYEDWNENTDSSYTDFDVYDSNQNKLLDVYDEADTSKAGTGTFGVYSGRTYYVKCRSAYWYSTYHFKVGYNIGTTSIKSVKAGKKAFNVKWAKKEKASFYQVRYIKKSVYSDYGWNKAKIVKLSKKTSSKTFTKLAKKNKYYVSVRVARTISGITYYSSWCKAKTVTTK